MVNRIDTSGEHDDAAAAKMLAAEYNAKVLDKLFAFLNTPTTTFTPPSPTTNKDTHEEEPPQAHN